MFDIYTIIFLALAVFIFLRLAQRAWASGPGASGRPTILIRRATPCAPGERQGRDACRRAPEAATPAPSRRRRPADRWKGVAERARPSQPGSTPLSAADPTFDAKHFITGARAAYEMIVTAYAEGDRRSC